MITIVEAHGPVTVQDLGWQGWYRDGVGRSGAMDRLALMLGNVLLGNDEGAAAIEVPLTPFRLRFDAEVNFAVTGADCGATLDGRALPPYWAGHARAGQELRLGPVRSGGFAYVAVAGGIDVPTALGGRSTHLRGAFGGFEGRRLHAGDVLPAGTAASALPAGGIGTLPLPLGMAGDGAIALRALPASEYDRYLHEDQARFWDETWTVTAQSNRTGYRLDGPVLRMRERLEMRSHGIVPGIVQVPSGGTPIIQLADAATMGGYPKIATVIEADLWRLGQMRAGQKLRFVPVGYGEAVRALDELNAHVADCRRQVAMARRSLEKLQ